MAISCGATCARSILLAFNVIFWFSGCILLIIGGWLIVDPNGGRLLNVMAPAHLPPTLHLPIAYVLVSLGGIILLVGFIGCCGALQESRCLLAAYFVFLVLILAAELLVAVVTLLFREHVMIDLEGRTISRLRNTYGQEDHKDFSLALDYFQYKYNCCGVSGDDDYLTSHWLNQSTDNDKTKSVPITCCILKNGNVTHPAGSPISVVSRVFYGHVEEPWQNPQPLSEIACQTSIAHTFETARHRQGCLQFIDAEFKRYSLAVIATGLIASVLQILGMMFSICLCRNITEDI